MSTLASNNINIDIADTQMQRAQKRDSQHIEVSKLSITSILKNVTEAAVITSLDGEIIGYNKQLRELVPHISDAQSLTDLFKLTSSSLNTPCLRQLSAIVGRRSGSFPIQLTTVQINDKYGHPTGDEAIKVFADCLLTQARPTDVVGRWGGEEFVVLLTNSSSEQARVYLERVMAKIRLLCVPYESGHISMTASAGYCEFSQAKSVEHSFTQADKALYAAKSDGRDRYKRATD